MTACKSCLPLDVLPAPEKHVSALGTELFSKGTNLAVKIKYNQDMARYSKPYASGSCCRLGPHPNSQSWQS